MHDQRIGGPLPPEPGTRTHDLQRKVLVELALAPPPHTDDIPELANRIGEPLGEVETALGALAEAGLAGSDGRLAWATAAARYCEALFPIYP
jgi:hypothetical protein